MALTRKKCYYCGKSCLVNDKDETDICSRKACKIRYHPKTKDGMQEVQTWE